MISFVPLDSSAQDPVCKIVRDGSGKRLETMLEINGAVMVVTTVEKSKKISERLIRANSVEKKNELLMKKVDLLELQNKIYDDRIKTLMLVKIPQPDPEVKFFKSPYTTFVLGAVFTGIMFGYWSCVGGDKICIQR